MANLVEAILTHLEPKLAKMTPEGIVRYTIKQTVRQITREYDIDREALMADMLGDKVRRFPSHRRRVSAHVIPHRTRPNSSK